VSNYLCATAHARL